MLGGIQLMNKRPLEDHSACLVLWEGLLESSCLAHINLTKHFCLMSLSEALLWGNLYQGPIDADDLASLSLAFLILALTAVTSEPFMNLFVNICLLIFFSFFRMTRVSLFLDL